jgi:hypothetical protein
MLAAMGDEAAVSFPIAAERRLLNCRKLSPSTTPKPYSNFRKIQQVGKYISGNGVPMTFAYVPSVEKYHGIDIGLYQFKFTAKDPNDASMKAVEMMYGKEGLQYPMAVPADKFLIAMGPNAMTQLKAMIDAKQPGPAVGDMKAALALITDNTKSEMVASINLLKLMKGTSQMGQQMIAQSGKEMPDFWKGIELIRQAAWPRRCFIDQWRVAARSSCPKNTSKRPAVMMQIQQEQMKYYQQQQTQTGADANTASRP